MEHETEVLPVAILLGTLLIASIFKNSVYTHTYKEGRSHKKDKAIIVQKELLTRHDCEKFFKGKEYTSKRRRRRRLTERVKQMNVT